MLELLRSLPIKPAMGKYPEQVGNSSTADQQWKKKKWTTSFLRVREAICAGTAMFWLRNGREFSAFNIYFFFLPWAGSCEQCDDNLSHVILSYSDFLAALCAQNGLVRDHSLETAVGITETQKAPKSNADTINE